MLMAIMSALFFRFTDNSVIVAIKTSGHAYSMRLYRLNFGKNPDDLILRSPFNADVITLQDPADNSRVRTIDKFEHMRQMKAATAKRAT